MSTPPRRPTQPFSHTRASYQVGRPWMLRGKMLRGLTGTPIRMTDLANNSLADADPDPLTLANLMTKSLMLRSLQPVSMLFPGFPGGRQAGRHVSS